MTKRIREPRKRTRTVQIKFWATPEEKELIEKKMALTGIVHMGAYLRKMAIDGYVVNLEIQEFKEIIRLLGIQPEESTMRTWRKYELESTVSTTRPGRFLSSYRRSNKRRNGAQPQKNSASKGDWGKRPNKQFWRSGYRWALLATTITT